MEKKILSITDITKDFGEGENKTRVLNQISLGITEGEFASIMGPSGCGKSTLLYIIGGLLTPTAGQVILDNKAIFKLKDNEMSELRRSVIGFIFQFYNLVQNLTVEENIMVPIIMAGRKAKDLKKELDSILEMIGLSGHRKQYPHQLSGGQQQRVAIARAVIASPRIILADEPIGNLDSKSGKSVMDLFARINREKKITILQVTHSAEAAQYGNRIIHLLDGSIRKDEKLIKN